MLLHHKLLCVIASAMMMMTMMMRTPSMVDDDNDGIENKKQIRVYIFATQKVKTEVEKIFINSF